METVGSGGRQVAEYDARGRVYATTEVNPLGDGANRTVIYAKTIT